MHQVRGGVHSGHVAREHSKLKSDANTKALPELYVNMRDTES